MRKTYRIDFHAYDNDGRHRQTGQLFSDFIADLEQDYHEAMYPMRANVFAGNARVLLLLESCFELEENTIMGMDLIDGELNMEVNAAIERYSQMTTLCGVGSQLPGNEDEPLFLVRDTRLHDTVVELYWMPDDDDDESATEAPEVPAAHRHRQPVPVLL